MLVVILIVIINIIVNDLYFLWESMLNLLLVLYSNYKYTRTQP